MNIVLTPFIAITLAISAAASAAPASEKPTVAAIKKPAVEIRFVAAAEKRPEAAKDLGNAVKNVVAAKNGEVATYYNMQGYPLASDGSLVFDN